MSNNDYTEDREPLNTLNMIEEGFFSKLNANVKEKITKFEKNDPIGSLITEASNSQSNINTEKLLLELYDIRDEMIEGCKDIDISSKVASTLTKNINKIGSFIKAYGGKVEHFDPLNNASGLETPDITVNAERVIENTRRAYKLGQIKNAQVNKNGKEIVIEFVGKKEDMVYKALGTICANGSWTGGEYLDYVYCESSGKMFVKALNNEGKWADKSSDFKISWELWEDKVGKEEKNEVKIAGNEEKNIEIIKENKILEQNNIEEDIGDDFSIEEKSEN